MHYTVMIARGCPVCSTCDYRCPLVPPHPPTGCSGPVLFGNDLNMFVRSCVT